MSELTRWLLALAALNVFNLFYTVNVFYSRQVILVNLCCLVLVWITSEVVNSKRLPVLLWVIVLSGVAVSLEGIAQWLGKGILLPLQTSGTPVATIGNTNYLGAFLLFGIFATLSLQSRHRLLIIPPLLLLAGGLMLSRARASWLGCAVGLTVFAALSLPRRWFVAVMLWAVLAGIVGWSVLPDQIKQADTLGYRLKYWQAAGKLWIDSPLLGIGFDGYRSHVYEAQAQLAKRDPTWFDGYKEPKPRHVHNDYLQALVDGGLLYFAVYFGFVVWVMAKSYRTARAYPLIRGIWCGQVAMLVAAGFFFPLRLVDTAMLFHVQLGVLCEARYNEELSGLSARMTG